MDKLFKIEFDQKLKLIGKERLSLLPDTWSRITLLQEITLYYSLEVTIFAFKNLIYFLF